MGASLEGGEDRCDHITCMVGSNRKREVGNGNRRPRRRRDLSSEAHRLDNSITRVLEDAEWKSDDRLHLMSHLRRKMLAVVRPSADEQYIPICNKAAA